MKCRKDIGGNNNKIQIIVIITVLYTWIIILYFGANIMLDELHGHIVTFLKVYTCSWFKTGLKFQQGANYL